MDEITIGTLNMQGGSRLKLAEIHTNAREEAIQIFAVTETHLRNDEKPYLDNEWKWVGNIRQTGEKKGGGVGFMLKRQDVRTTKPELNCKEHLWITVHLRGNRKINICSTYMATSEKQAWNENIYNCIEKDMNTKFHGEPVIILGDFNCHIAELGGKDHKAENFRKLVKNQNLEIANLNPYCAGKITWTGRHQQSTIDYVLINQEVEKDGTKITAMHIDERKKLHE